MRDWKEEFDNRVAFIKELMAESHASGLIFGNSGGKDSALVGALCKAACSDTVGVIMPCGVGRNYSEDLEDAKALAAMHDIESRIVDLGPVREAELAILSGVTEVTASALANIAPRLRMTTLYAIAGSENRLVAGTGNRDEMFTGYFTKWGDGAHDFNPISDLTVAEVYEFLAYVGAPENILKKAPSAALAEGQTDEGEMGVSYSVLDKYILTGGCEDPEARKRMDHLHAVSNHKRRGIARYRLMPEQ